MSDVLDTLKSYPDDASIIMSKRVVEDIIDEIARLRVERDAVRAELSDALVLAAQHLDCFRTERWELGNVMRERDALRAELAAARNEHENLILMWRNETAEIEKALNAAEAERDALRAQLAKAREALEPFAEVASSYDPDEGDGKNVAWAHDFTIGSLRRARAVLKGGVDE